MLVLSIILLLTAQFGSVRSVALLMNSNPLSKTFFSAFYEGSPVFVLPQSINFDTSETISSIQVSLQPASDVALEGLSFSTLGTSVTSSSIGTNSFLFRGNGSSAAPQSDYLKVLRTLTFYHFASILRTSTLQVVIAVTSGNGAVSASASFLRLSPTRNLNCTRTTRNIDVVLLLDSSAISSSPKYWNDLGLFWGEVLEKLPVSSQNIRMAAVSVSTTPTLIFDFQTSFDGAQLTTLLRNAPYLGGSFNLTGALSYVQSQLLTTSRGYRNQGVAVFLFSNGSSPQLNTLLADSNAAASLKAIGAQIFVTANSATQLQVLASQPISFFFLESTTFLAGILKPGASSLFARQVVCGANTTSHYVQLKSTPTPTPVANAIVTTVIATVLPVSTVATTTSSSTKSSTGVLSSSSTLTSSSTRTSTSSSTRTSTSSSTSTLTSSSTRTLTSSSTSSTTSSSTTAAPSSSTTTATLSSTNAPASSTTISTTLTSETSSTLTTASLDSTATSTAAGVVSTSPANVILCGNIAPLDLVFILDSSGSLGAANWLQVKQFAANVVDQLPIGVSQTQFAD